MDIEGNNGENPPEDLVSDKNLTEPKELKNDEEKNSDNDEHTAVETIRQSGEDLNKTGSNDIQSRTDDNIEIRKEEEEKSLVSPSSPGFSLSEENTANKDEKDIVDSDKVKADDKLTEKCSDDSNLIVDKGDDGSIISISEKNLDLDESSESITEDKEVSPSISKKVKLPDDKENVKNDNNDVSIKKVESSKSDDISDNPTSPSTELAKSPSQKDSVDVESPKKVISDNPVSPNTDLTKSPSQKDSLDVQSPKKVAEIVESDDSSDGEIDSESKNEKQLDEDESKQLDVKSPLCDISSDEGELSDDDDDNDHKQQAESENKVNNKDEDKSRSHILSTRTKDRSNSSNDDLDDHGELDYDEDVEDNRMPMIEKAPKQKLEEEEEREEGEESPDEKDEDKNKENDDDHSTDGEIKDEEDCEEGEIPDPDGRKPFAKPLCRFFARGHCTWGVTCRFLHPGVNDKGNYNMIDVPGVRNVNRGPPPKSADDFSFGEDFELPPPPPPPEVPAVESSWQRGLRHAKELMKRATRRKELETNLHEKKMNLSLPEDKDFNKENEKQVKDPYYDADYQDEEDARTEPAAFEPKQSWPTGQFENFEVRWTRPDYQPPLRGPQGPRDSPMIDRPMPRRKERVRSPGPMSNQPRPHPAEAMFDVPPRRQDRPGDRPGAPPKKSGHGGKRADDWHDPWRRSKSPNSTRKPKRRTRSRERTGARRYRTYSKGSYSSSYSSSDSGSSRGSRSNSYSSSSSYSSGSGSSSDSSKSPSPGRNQHLQIQRMRQRQNSDKRPGGRPGDQPTRPGGRGAPPNNEGSRGQRPRPGGPPPGRKQERDRPSGRGRQGRTPPGRELPKEALRKVPEPKPRVPEPRSREPEPKSKVPDTRTREPDTRSREPETRSREPDPRSREPDPRSREPDTRSREPDTRSREPDTRIRDPDTRNREPDTRIREPDPRSRDPAPRNDTRGVRLPEARGRPQKKEAPRSKRSPSASSSSSSSSFSSSSRSSLSSASSPSSSSSSDTDDSDADDKQKKKVKKSKDIKEKEKPAVSHSRYTAPIKNPEVPRATGHVERVQPQVLPKTGKDLLKMTGKKSITLTLKKASDKPLPIKRSVLDPSSSGPPSKKAREEPPRRPNEKDKPKSEPKPTKSDLRSPPPPMKKPAVPPPKQEVSKPPVKKAPPPPPAAKPEVEAPKPAAKAPKKNPGNRRDELLKQLKAVEDAIAKKRKRTN